MITKASAQSFAVWLLNTHPAIFYAIAKKQNPGLGAFSDIVSNISGAFSSAVSSVGNFISNPQNVQALTGLAGTYFATQAAQANASAQQSVLQTQLARAQAGQTAAPIAYTTNAQGQPVPVYTGAPQTAPYLGAQTVLPSGQIGYAVTPQTLQTLAPGFLQKYGLWIAVGGGLLFVGLFLTR